MSPPVIIRTKFPTAEEVAEIYGMPKRRVKELIEILTEGKKKRVRKRDRASKTGNVFRGKQRSAKKR